MDLYHVVLFAHIIGAVIVVGSGFFFPPVIAGAARATSLSSFREWGGVIQKMSKITGAAAAVILLSGLYMGITTSRFDEGWIVVSLVLFVINGALAGGLLSKHWNELMAKAEEAGDGPVPAEVRALTLSPRMHLIESISLGNDIVIVFLMTNQPGWRGSLVSVGVGVVLIAALAARGRHKSPAGAPATS